MGILLSKKIVRNYQADTLPQAIVPVPLHNKRLRARGFNQAIEIAKPLAKTLHLPILRHHVCRHRHTPAQAELTAKQRLSNVKQAFSIKKPIKFSHIAIVDDVITTASTVTELAQLLHQHGVERIDIWACSHAQLKTTVIAQK